MTTNRLSQGPVVLRQFGVLHTNGEARSIVVGLQKMQSSSHGAKVLVWDDVDPVGEACVGGRLLTPYAAARAIVHLAKLPFEVSLKTHCIYVNQKVESVVAAVVSTAIH
jgi:hypothetical protein